MVGRETPAGGVDLKMSRLIEWYLGSWKWMMYLQTPFGTNGETNMMTKKVISACVALSAISGSIASAEIVNDLFMIDSFSNAFSGESFVGSYSNGTANSFYEVGGLEVGLLLLGEGYASGDAHPGWTPRQSEVQYQTGLDGVLGGARQGELFASRDLGSPVTVRAGGDRLSFNTAFGTRAKLDLLYDGGGQLNHNFTSIQDGAFKLSFIGGDLYSENGRNRPVPIKVELTSGLGTGQEASASVGSTLLRSGEDHLFNFADFTGINLSDIDQVRLSIDQTDESLAAVDFTVGAFSVVGTVVPAPGGLALIVGVGAIGLRRRR